MDVPRTLNLKKNYFPVAGKKKKSVGGGNKTINQCNSYVSFAFLHSTISPAALRSTVHDQGNLCLTEQPLIKTMATRNFLQSHF